MYTSSMAKDENSFVSRRGKRVRLSDFNDTKTKNPTTIEPTDAPEPRAQNPVKRRTRLWVAIATFLAFLVPVMIGEFATFNFQHQVNTGKKQASSFIQDVVRPVHQRNDLSAQTLAQLTDRIESFGSSMCKPSPFSSLVDLYPRAKSALMDCNEEKAKYTSLAKYMRTYQHQREFVEKLSRVLSGVVATPPDQFAETRAQLDMWTKTTQELKSIDTPSELRPAHKTFVEKSEAITAAWSQLNSAFYDQDGYAFSLAKEKLSAAYPEFRDSADEFDKVLEQSQAEILRTYKQIK